MSIKLTAQSVGPFQVNCVLVQTGQGILIVDPGDNSAEILQTIQQLNLPVSAYLLTHGHVDHLCALAKVAEQHPAPIYMHAEDQKWAFTSRNSIEPYYPMPQKPGNCKIFPIQDGEILAIGGIDIHVIHTPGHSPGSCCFYFKEDNILIAGDTLFRESVGRTDLPGGDSRTLAQSLKKLRILPPDTTVLSGHGPETTIRHELKHNFYMQRPAS